MTDVEICNLALQHVGLSEYIEDLDEDTAEARACSVAFAHCRQVLLSSFPWPFAERFVSLTALDEETVGRTDWGYVYALPADALTAGDTWTGARAVNPSGRTSFRVAMNLTGTGRVFYTDATETEIVYTADVAAALFPPLAAEALSWRVAAQIAMPLTKNPALRLAAIQGYAMAFALAAGHSVAQASEATPESEFITIRS